MDLTESTFITTWPMGNRVAPKTKENADGDDHVSGSIQPTGRKRKRRSLPADVDSGEDDPEIDNKLDSEESHNDDDDVDDTNDNNDEDEIDPAIDPVKDDEDDEDDEDEDDDDDDDAGPEKDRADDNNEEKKDNENEVREAEEAKMKKEAEKDEKKKKNEAKANLAKQKADLAKALKAANELKAREAREKAAQARARKKEQALELAKKKEEAKKERDVNDKERQSPDYEVKHIETRDDKSRDDEKSQTSPHAASKPTAAALPPPPRPSLFGPNSVFNAPPPTSRGSSCDPDDATPGRSLFPNKSIPSRRLFVSGTSVDQLKKRFSTSCDMDVCKLQSDDEGKDMARHKCGGATSSCNKHIHHMCAMEGPDTTKLCDTCSEAEQVKSTQAYGSEASVDDEIPATPEPSKEKPRSIAAPSNSGPPGRRTSHTPRPSQEKTRATAAPSDAGPPGRRTDATQPPSQTKPRATAAPSNAGPPVRRTGQLLILSSFVFY